MRVAGTAPVRDSQGVTEDLAHPVPTQSLRYRRLGGGYRREDVERALADLQWAMRGLEEDVESLRARSGELETELHEVRGELEAYRARESELEQVVQAAGTALERASRVEAAISDRSQGVSSALKSLREDLSRLEQAVAELEGPDAERAAPPDGAEPTAP